MKIGGKEIDLPTQIFAAILLGMVLRIVIGEPMIKARFIGTIWPNCTKMITVSMVLVIIITGAVSQRDMKTLGRISFRTMIYYIVTTLIVCAIDILAISIVKLGAIANFTGLVSKGATGSTDITVVDSFTGMFSSSIAQTSAGDNIFQTVATVILLGVTILRMKNPEYKERAVKGMNVLDDMISSPINMIILAPPIGIFFLMGGSLGKYRAGIFTSVVTLVDTYYLACLVYVVLVYHTVIQVTAEVDPSKFLKDSVELWVYTISIYFSVAVIPISIEMAEEKFSVSEIIPGFTVPLGSQMNYNGGAILYGCVIPLISQIIGVPVTLGTMVKTILTSAILPAGDGGIPGSGIIKFPVMITVFGLPMEIVGIIAALYHLLDMGTITNDCLGDPVGTVFVSKLENRAAARAEPAQAVCQIV